MSTHTSPSIGNTSSGTLPPPYQLPTSLASTPTVLTSSTSTTATFVDSQGYPTTGDVKTDLDLLAGPTINNVHHIPLTPLSHLSNGQAIPLTLSQPPSAPTSAAPSPAPTKGKNGATGPAEGKTKPHICQVCMRGFTTGGHLQRHQRIHTGVKAFRCPFPGCDTRTSRQDNLQQHYRTHLSPTLRRGSGSQAREAVNTAMEAAGLKSIAPRAPRKSKGSSAGTPSSSSGHVPSPYQTPTGQAFPFIYDPTHFAAYPLPPPLTALPTAPSTNSSRVPSPTGPALPPQAFYPQAFAPYGYPPQAYRHMPPGMHTAYAPIPHPHFYPGVVAPEHQQMYLQPGFAREGGYSMMAPGYAPMLNGYPPRANGTPISLSGDDRPEFRRTISPSRTRRTPPEPMLGVDPNMMNHRSHPMMQPQSFYQHPQPHPMYMYNTPTPTASTSVSGHASKASTATDAMGHRTSISSVSDASASGVDVKRLSSGMISEVTADTS